MTITTDRLGRRCLEPTLLRVKDSFVKKPRGSYAWACHARAVSFRGFAPRPLPSSGHGFTQLPKCIGSPRGHIGVGKKAMALKLLATVVTLVLASSVSAQAQPLLTGSDTAEILNAARRFGSAQLASQANGDPIINGRIEAISYQVYFRNCTDNADCEDLNFYAGFLDNQPTLEAINAWNRDKRFSRAYIDEDQDACVEMDLDLVQGVTAEHLDAQFGLWAMVLAEFTDHIDYR